jgi:hypothetical protein
MIRNNEKTGGIGEWLIVCKPTGIGMPVRADDRQIANRFIKRAGDGSDCGFGRKETVLMKNGHGIYFRL